MRRKIINEKEEEALITLTVSIDGKYLSQKGKGD